MTIPYTSWRRFLVPDVIPIVVLIGTAVTYAGVRLYQMNNEHGASPFAHYSGYEFDLSKEEVLSKLRDLKASKDN